MAKEIEYKFLVDAERWAKVTKPEPHLIIQGFLSKSENMVVRVRIMDNQGFLTIKGKSVGLSRTEFEYEIPVEDAQAMLSEFTGKFIRKNRYAVQIGAHCWEVDVFEGNLEGLILAELEVGSETETFDKPEWIGKDVSTDPDYYNAVLIERC
jgi:CYTH domain-containing protein